MKNIEPHLLPNRAYYVLNFTKVRSCYKFCTWKAWGLDKALVDFRGTVMQIKAPRIYYCFNTKLKP